MARKVRTSPTGVPQLVKRDAAEGLQLWRDDQDCLQFHNYLCQYAARYPLKIHAWSLSRNALYLLLTPHAPDAIGRLLQAAGRQYAQYYNSRYHRQGGIWYDRYRASLILDNSLLLPLTVFVENQSELNPHTSAPTSSYRLHANGTGDALVTVSSAYESLADDVLSRQQIYRKEFLSLSATGTGEKWRGALNKQHALGDDKFIKRIEQVTGRRLSAGKRGRPAKEAG